MGKAPNIEMADNLNQPQDDDAVLGGQIPAPADGAVLGGIAGVKRRLASTIVGQRIAALYQALNYGEAGLDLVIQALEDKSKQVQQAAQKILFEERANPKVRQVWLQRYPNVFFECLYTLSPADGFEISTVAISPDGQTFASCSFRYTIELWNLHTGELIYTFAQSTGRGGCRFCSVAFSPDGQFLASSGLDNNIHLWDLGTGERFHTLKGHSDYVNEVAISPDGQTLISGSCDRTIKVWGIC